MVECFIVQYTARAEFNAFPELAQAALDPGRIVEACDRQSSRVNAHQLNRRLVLPTWMKIRQTVWILGHARNHLRKIGPGSICPDKFVKQNYPNATRFD